MTSADGLGRSLEPLAQELQLLSQASKNRAWSTYLGKLYRYKLHTRNIFHNAMRVCVDITSLFAQEADESDVLPPREFDRHS